MTDMAPKLGGLVEFYRSPARVAWTPTGTNVPDYPKLAQLWWKNVAVAVTGEKTPQAAMDTLADEMDQVMAPSRARRHGALPAQAQRQGRPEQVAERQGRAVEEAGQREAEGRDDRLRDAAERLEGGQGRAEPGLSRRPREGPVGDAPASGEVGAARRPASAEAGRDQRSSGASGSSFGLTRAFGEREVAHQQRVDGIDRLLDAGGEPAFLERRSASSP